MAKKNRKNEKPKKQKYEVKENESITDCLDRIAADGYRAVRRMEEPVFEEVTGENGTDYVPVRQAIVFEAKLNEDTN
ncbi:NETI protein [Salsuginibacillus halophilus]|uniref:NETI protein n=1 Tax=Salsuginibacillus halophilus TaxID=517424 RepID=A0A2P8HLC7_9BACI|nr:NETI motif-containing protein [Salsuginibacillus halophilus]PSL47032.1 NETI protein [Salsuginibacillus halophilus]